jgi:hypothetical protein
MEDYFIRLAAILLILEEKKLKDLSSRLKNG